MKKLIGIYCNPEPRHVRRAAAVCAKINDSREFGDVCFGLFHRLNKVILGLFWRQSRAAMYSQEMLDAQPKKGKRLDIEIFQDHLGADMIKHKNFILTKKSIRSIRSLDKNPTLELTEKLPELKHVTIKDGNDIWGFLDMTFASMKCFTKNEAVAMDPSGHISHAFIYDTPSVLQATLLFDHYRPNVSLFIPDTGVMYQLMEPVMDGVQEVFARSTQHDGQKAMYRLFKLDGVKITELPLMPINNCACGHVLEFECPDGMFKFNMHPKNQKGWTYHGFIHSEGVDPQRFMVMLNAKTLSPRDKVK